MTCKHSVRLGPSEETVLSPCPWCAIEKLRKGIKATRDGCCGRADNILCCSCRKLEELLKQEPQPQSAPISEKP